MTTIKGIPVYTATIDGSDDYRMLRVSLVDEPAVMKDFLSFSKEAVPMRYAVQDEEKRLVRGVLMRANYPIYRYDKDMGEYFIMYKPEVLRDIAEKYLAEGRTGNVNLMHEDGSDVEGVEMVQMFIKDTAHGINPAGFDEIEDGSLFGEYHVLNDEVWQGIKDGTYKGFSIEVFNAIEPEQGVISTEKIQDILDMMRSSIINNDMSILKDARLKLAKMVGKFGNVTTDKATLSWDGDGELEAGMEVFLLDEDGNRSAVEDGDYKTEDGKVIVVADSKVSEIRDDKAEVAPQDGGEALRRMRAIKAAYELSYDEKYAKIAAALTEALGEEFAYILEAGDDYVIVCLFSEDGGTKIRRYALTWDGGEVKLGDYEDGKMGFIPDGAPAEPEGGEGEGGEGGESEEMRRMSQRMAQMEQMMSQIVDVLGSIKGAPAAQPAHETFTSTGAPLKTEKSMASFIRMFGNK